MRSPQDRNFVLEVNIAHPDTATSHSMRAPGKRTLPAAEITKKRTQPMTNLIDGLWAVGIAFSFGFTAYGALLCLGLNYRASEFQARVAQLALFRT
jgi:hypothetical protein